MRTFGAAILLLCALACTVGAAQPASAQGAHGTQGACVPGPDKLGVARTAAIDTSSGPLYGAQYKGRTPLAQGEVVLTFDDGPSRTNTRPILEALAAQCTKATFFMLGQMALADPQLVREVAQQGHTIATHTWSHANMQSLPPIKAQDEIEMGFSAVRLALGKPIAPFFRFPYLRDTPFALGHLKSRRLATFSIDIDSRDFETKDAAAVYERVMRGLAANPRGIILFHDIHASTARALPRILAEIKARGLRVVHLVPKAGAETLPEYDALAQQQADRKRIAVARNPLSKRAITWPSAALSDAQALAKAPPSPLPRQPPGEEEDWTVKFWQQ
jgi:peptidoglycan/xylan/chitin deacetylase (PgdA/CDA1 family)